MPFVIILCDSETAYYENLVVARTYDFMTTRRAKNASFIKCKN